MATLIRTALLNLLKSQFPTRKWNNNFHVHGLLEYQRRKDMSICPPTTDIDIEMLMSVIGITITFDKTEILAHICACSLKAKRMLMF